MKRKNGVTTLLSDEELALLRKVPGRSDAEKMRTLIAGNALATAISREIGALLIPEIKGVFEGMKEHVDRERAGTREMIRELSRQMAAVLKQTGAPQEQERKGLLG